MSIEETKRFIPPPRSASSDLEKSAESIRKAISSGRRRFVMMSPSKREDHNELEDGYLSPPFDRVVLTVELFYSIDERFDPPFVYYWNAAVDDSGSHWVSTEAWIENLPEKL